MQNINKKDKIRALVLDLYLVLEDKLNWDIGIGIRIVVEKLDKCVPNCLIKLHVSILKIGNRSDTSHNAFTAHSLLLFMYFLAICYGFITQLTVESKKEMRDEKGWEWRATACKVPGESQIGGIAITWSAP